MGDDDNPEQRRMNLYVLPCLAVSSISLDL